MASVGQYSTEKAENAQVVMHFVLGVVTPMTVKVKITVQCVIFPRKKYNKPLVRF